MTGHWDVIVIGLGGVGSSAAFHLAKTGRKVLGIDQFAPVHDRGSSHGRTRVIRQAYFEHPDYVPLLRRAYRLWKELEQESGQRLYQRTGIVEIGPADGVVVPGVLQSARDHDLNVQQLQMSEVTSRWPVLRGDHDWTAVIESDAGFLRVESCVDAHLSLARASGCVCLHNQSVRKWQVDGSHISVTTDDGTQYCRHLVVASGAWSGPLLGRYGVPLTVLRKYQYWFATDDARFDLASEFPCFFFETPQGYFYGFPRLDNSGVKVSRHSGGRVLSDATIPVRDVDEPDAQLVCEFNKQYTLGLESPPRDRSGCFYTVTPDEHFIVDQLPDTPAVNVVAGLSGHGFKFTSVLGEMVAQMVHDQSNACVPELFRLARFLR
ncbi:MAG: N-methyl-L-tryptophan oxidase [Pirellulaceae bacterium]|nr:N-methyl-L-tryptophan oxidase [Pirellulaceae bacterium]